MRISHVFVVLLLLAVLAASLADARPPPRPHKPHGPPRDQPHPPKYDGGPPDVTVESSVERPVEVHPVPAKLNSETPSFSLISLIISDDTFEIITVKFWFVVDYFIDTSMIEEPFEVEEEAVSLHEFRANHSHFHGNHSHWDPYPHHRFHGNHSRFHGNHSRFHGNHSHFHGNHSHFHGNHSHWHPYHHHRFHGNHSHFHGNHSHFHGNHSHWHPYRHHHFHGNHSHFHGNHSHFHGNHSHWHPYPFHGNHSHFHGNHSHGNHSHWYPYPFHGNHSHFHGNHSHWHPYPFHGNHSHFHGNHSHWYPYPRHGFHGNHSDFRGDYRQYQRDSAFGRYQSQSQIDCKRFRVAAIQKACEQRMIRNLPKSNSDLMKHDNRDGNHLDRNICDCIASYFMSVRWDRVLFVFCITLFTLALLRFLYALTKVFGCVSDNEDEGDCENYLKYRPVASDEGKNGSHSSKLAVDFFPIPEANQKNSADAILV